jgi:hypothetical protein
MLDLNEIEIGGEYATENNQHRVVLGCSKDCKIVYVSRGGNVQNGYNTCTESSLELFASVCERKLRQVPPKEFEKIFNKNKCDKVQQGSNCCLNKKGTKKEN